MYLEVAFVVIAIVAEFAVVSENAGYVMENFDHVKENGSHFFR